HRQSHIAYVQNWITVLQNEPKELFRAVKAAEEISDYLLEKGDFQASLAAWEAGADLQSDIDAYNASQQNDLSAPTQDWEMEP
ncbi:MAG TPA: hypothetical protein IAC31_00750, partial [Candidatus Faecousia intestinigallinarum]|nr:hypothetical protein [Candidatus Faecousia intestinigallinarum]